MADVLLGVVIGAAGLRGEVKVKTFTAEPEALGRYGALTAKDGRCFKVESLRPLKDDLVQVKFAGLGDRNAAEALKGIELFTARARLPETAPDEFYHADLVGLAAEDEAGRSIGRVSAIHNFGAGDVIEIAREDGDSALFPFTREFVPLIDVRAKRIVIAAPEETEAETKGNVE